MLAAAELPFSTLATANSAEGTGCGLRTDVLSMLLSFSAGTTGRAPDKSSRRGRWGELLNRELLLGCGVMRTGLAGKRLDCLDFDLGGEDSKSEFDLSGEGRGPVTDANSCLSSDVSASSGMTASVDGGVLSAVCMFGRERRAMIAGRERWVENRRDSCLMIGRTGAERPLRCCRQISMAQPASSKIPTITQITMTTVRSSGASPERGGLGPDVACASVGSRGCRGRSGNVGGADGGGVGVGNRRN